MFFNGLLSTLILAIVGTVVGLFLGIFLAFGITADTSDSTFQEANGETERRLR